VTAGAVAHSCHRMISTSRAGSATRSGAHRVAGRDVVAVEKDAHLASAGTGAEAAEPGSIAAAEWVEEAMS
jgi:hypothetical protein